MLAEKDEVINLIIFVDDLLICGKNERKMKDIKDKLSEKFKMKDLGEVRTYLGINIKHGAWAGDKMDRKSTTGYLIRMYENVKNVN